MNLNDMLEKSAIDLTSELLKGENGDLMVLVRDLGDSSSYESFQWGFHKILTEQQNVRWNEIIDEFDDGWSGFAYGFICRKSQWFLKNLEEFNKLVDNQ